jgi:hypothetical protein
LLFDCSASSIPPKEPPRFPDVKRRKAPSQLLS